MHAERQKKASYFTLTIILLIAGINFIAAQSPAKRPGVPAQTVRQLTEAALVAFQAEDFPKAENLLKRIFSAAPKNVEAHTLAGVIAELKNDLPTAEKHFAAAARLAPKRPETRNNYGAILFRLGRTREAAKEFEISLAENQSQPSAQINLAQIYFARETEADWRAARKLFESATANAPDSAVARAVVIVSLRLGEKRRAAEDYRKYNAFIEKNSLPANDRTELGDALLNGGLIDEAVIELEAAAAAEPNNFNALISLSRAYLKQKNIKSAGRVLESALVRGIEDAKIYAALTEVYEAGGYYENAVPAMRLAIERDPRNEHYRFRYGMLLIETKAPPAAVIRLAEAVREFPKSARIRLGLGIAQYLDAKLNDAEKSLNEALELDPRLFLAYAYLAFIRNAGGQSEAASSYFERALAIDEKNAVLHYLLADNMQKIAASDPAEIEKHLRRAIELEPELGGAYLALGRLYARQKKNLEAAPLLEKTIRLDPSRTEAYYQLAQVYSRLKRAEESRALMAKFKELSERDKDQTKNEYTELLRRMANVRF